MTGCMICTWLCWMCWRWLYTTHANTVLLSHRESFNSLSHCPRFWRRLRRWRKRWRYWGRPWWDEPPSHRRVRWLPPRTTPRGESGGSCGSVALISSRSVVVSSYTPLPVGEGRAGERERRKGGISKTQRNITISPCLYNYLGFPTNQPAFQTFKILHQICTQ